MADAADPPRLLSEAVDAIDQGLLWLDAEFRVAGCNAAYRRLLELGDANAFVGRPYDELLAHLGARAGCDGQAERQLAAHLAAAKPGAPPSAERLRPDGLTLAISAAPLASGGYVFIYRDVTHERLARIAKRRQTKATVVALANFAEHRDRDTGVHVLRVARLVGQTARKLMALPKYAGVIDEAYVEHVATAAVLHDVGKITTPDGILLKPGALTPEEREIMKRHAAEGAHLLRQASLSMGESPYLKYGADIALTHHESFDGRGYPAGLAGEAIPLCGRICAIADVFDALTSRRPYKAPWPLEKALDLLRQQSGAQFDPDIVTAFLAVIEERERIRIIGWREDFSVGNLHIDEQHGILIDIINQLASAESLDDHYALAMVIDELVNYAAFHFDYEEQLMARAGYADLDNHRIIHQAFVRWTEELRDAYDLRGGHALGEAVLDYLGDWLSHHILGEDQRYRECVARLG